MTSDQPLIGYFSEAEYILVHGNKSCEDLKALGSFGYDTKHALRRDDDRLGPLDRRLTQQIRDNLSDDKTIALTLHEAYFLAHALGCLQIRSEQTCEPFDLKELWEKLRGFNQVTSPILDFAVEYGVYFYFRTRGWKVKSGFNFGVNFLLYREGPSIDHAQFAVIVIYTSKTVESDKVLNWRSLLTFQRVIQSVSKELVLAFVSDGVSPVDMSHPSCINNFQITLKKFVSQADVIPPKTG